MEDVKISLMSLIATKTRVKPTELKPHHDELQNKDGFMVTFENGTKAFCTLKLSMQANGRLDDSE